MFQDLIGQNDAQRPLAGGDKNLTHNEEASEILFLHASDDFIEKNLGEGESIVVHKQSLAAFSDQISIHEACKPDGWLALGYWRGSSFHQ
jgi:hypothetical protein